MSHPLNGARAKIARSREFLASLQAATATYLAPRPIAVEERQESDGQMRRIQWIARADPEPPAALGLIVGDWAQNLRTALDYTVYELVRAETGEEDPRWTQFPVTVEESQYARQRDRLRGVPAWSLPVFEGLQPFHDGEDEAPFHPLAILTDVSNRDKHRIVTTTAMQVAGSQARLEGTSLLSIHEIEQNPGSVVGERLILDALVRTDGDDFRIRLDIRVDVAIEGYELPLVPLLAWITDEVESIVDWFRPSLG